jgi:hypothetical protein
VRITCPPLLRLSHTRGTFTYKGGSGFPRPFDAFANALQFASLDLFSTLHIDCAANTNYVASLIFATTAPLVPIAIVNLFRRGDKNKLRKPYKVRVRTPV